ncbi:MAG: hypothetical protein KCHDKBKB_00906 [Elusimicrobia bacterium]|nr:hypothetical protein [Elusimicrobiota bacterium]
MTFLLLFLILSGGPLFAQDPIENLIEEEIKTKEEWTQGAEELPFVVFLGDKNGLKIQSDLICQPIPYDELIELSRGQASDRETVLNLDIPRVREILETICLLRPGDEVLAIQAGTQVRLPLKDFVVRQDAPACRGGSPFSLWGTFSEPLLSTPLFFVTQDTWAEGDNHFVALTEQNPGPFEQAWRAAVKNVLPDQDEFRLSFIDLPDLSPRKLIMLRRKVAQLEDNGLPHQILFMEQDTKVEKVWEERVDIKKGSGHFQVEAALDFNGNGFFDLWMSGVHQGCPYQMVLEGGEEGFRPLDMPLGPCGC